MKPDHPGRLPASGCGCRLVRKAMEEVDAQFNDQERQVLRKLLLAMVTLEPTSQFVTSDVSRADLLRICGAPQTTERVISTLIKHDLIFERPAAGTNVLSLTNGALLTAWPPLVTWLDELRGQERSRARLRQAATLWQDRVDTTTCCGGAAC